MKFKVFLLAFSVGFVFCFSAALFFIFGFSGNRNEEISELSEETSFLEEEKAVFKKYEHDYFLRPIAVPFENTVKTIKLLSERGCNHFLYTHRGNETSQHYLNECGIAKYFTAFVDSSNGFPAKPAPDAVEWICSTYNLDKNETIMIGDREIDVLSGKNAGTYGCLYTKKENIESAADFIVKDIADILDINKTEAKL